MEDNKRQKLNVILCGRSFPIIVEAEDVDDVLNIANEINLKVQEFQNTYKQKDIRDCLSMVLLTYAVDLHKAKHPSSTGEARRDLLQLDQLLDQYIQSS
jgi:cell division protein ZapA